MKPYYRLLPLLLAYLYIAAAGYMIITWGVSGDFNVVFDWAQFHTTLLVLLVLGASILLWVLTLWLSKKEFITKLSLSQAYAYFTALLFSITVGLVSAGIFLIYQIDIKHLVDTTEWIQHNLSTFLFSAFLLSLLTFGLMLVIGEAFLTSGIALVLFFIFAITNHYKLIFRNEPLFPNDLVQIGQMKDVIPLISDSISLPITIGIIAVCIGLLVLWFFLPKIKLKLIARIIVLIPVIFLIKSFLIYDGTFAEKYYSEYASLMPWNQNASYDHNGPVIGMVSNLKLNILEEPDTYTKGSMEKTLTSVKTVSSASTQTASSVFASMPTQADLPVKANIIFYMNETFWDPTKLDLNFSEDPLKNTRKLMEKYPSGSILSPAFGGNTANVEFEALTSYSMNYVNPGGLPYEHVLSHKDYPSFASYLDQLGYFTEAIHPNGGNLYRRQTVYPNIGFDKAEFIDDMKYTKKDNDRFVSDDSVVNEILDVVKQKKEPAFVHAVTIANHLPYGGNKYKDGTSIKVSGGNLSPDSKERVEVYSEGIKRSDQTLKRLDEEVQSLTEPTLVVVWGDHLPSLGPNLKAYKEANYGKGKKQSTNPDYYETPLLFISNFDTGLQKDVGVMSPIYFAPTIVHALDYKSNLFYNYLEEMNKKIPAFKENLYMQENGRIVNSPDDLPASTQKLLQNYHEMEFDVLSGDQYSKKKLY